MILELTGREGEFLVERIGLILLSIVPESGRYLVLEAIFRKLRKSAKVDLSEEELGLLVRELDPMPLERGSEEDALRRAISRKLGALE